MQKRKTKNEKRKTNSFFVFRFSYFTFENEKRKTNSFFLLQFWKRKTKKEFVFRFSFRNLKTKNEKRIRYPFFVRKFENEKGKNDIYTDPPGQSVNSAIHMHVNVIHTLSPCRLSNDKATITFRPRYIYYPQIAVLEHLWYCKEACCEMCDVNVSRT